MLSVCPRQQMRGSGYTILPVPETCHDRLLFPDLHSRMELKIPCASLLGDDTHRHIRMPCRPDLVSVKPDQRCAGADLLSFTHQIFKSVSIHIHGINTDMQQHFHTVCQPKPAGMPGLGHHHCHLGICRRIQDLTFRKDCHTVPHDSL